MPVPPAYAATIVLGLAASAYGLVQFAKSHFPAICGRHAVVLNVIISCALVLLTPGLSHDQVISWHTLSLMISAALSAGGVHGFIKTLFPGIEDPARQAADGAKQAPSGDQVVLPCVLALLMLATAGCKVVHAPTPAVVMASFAVDTLDFTANQALQAAHAFARRVTMDTMSGALKLSGTQKIALERLNATLNVVDAMEISYHQCGLIRQHSSTAPPCEAAALTSGITQVQQAFTVAEVALTPTLVK